MVNSKPLKANPCSSAQMFPLIREWELSGLSQKEFCAGRELKPHIFYYWLKRYREEYKLESKLGQGFVALEVEPIPNRAVLAEIVYGDGTRLILKERVGIDFLRALLGKSL